MLVIDPHVLFAGETQLLDIEGLGAVDVGHGDRDKLETHVHAGLLCGTLLSTVAQTGRATPVQVVRGRVRGPPRDSVWPPRARDRHRAGGRSSGCNSCMSAREMGMGATWTRLFARQGYCGPCIRTGAPTSPVRLGTPFTGSPWTADAVVQAPPLARPSSSARS